MKTCIFYEEPDETPKSKKKDLTKIVSYDKEIETEINNINTIKHRIPTYKEHFFVYKDTHMMTIGKLDSDLQYFNPKRLTGGECVFKFENRELIYYKNYLKSIESPKRYVRHLISDYCLILDSINELLNIGLVHRNIGFNTIVIDSERKIPLLVDFRHSIDINNIINININKEVFELSTIENDEDEDNILELPIELELIHYLRMKQLTSLSLFNIECFIADFYEKNNLLKAFGEKKCEEYVEESVNYLSKYVNKSINQIIDDVKNYHYTWDNYLLSIVFLKILTGLHNHIKDKLTNPNKFLILFIKLLVANINPNPQKRYSVLETKEQFNNIVFMCDINVYKEIIDNI